MIAVNNVLVPFDFGEASTRALDYARQLADAFHASLHVLHVIGHPLGSPPNDPDRSRGDVERDVDSEVRQRLETLLDPTDRDERHAVTACRFGTIATEIVEYAADHGVDLIVMGTHRHGPTIQMFTGSIAEEVVRLAPCPVLAVKAAAGAACEEDCGRQPPSTRVA